MASRCADCRTLSLDLLSKTTHLDDRWRLLTSEHATVSQSIRHLDWQIQSLHYSASQGCVLCAIIEKAIRKIDGSSSASTYCLFIWGRSPERCEIQVGVSGIESFLSHVSEIPAFRTLEFFVQKGKAASTPHSIPKSKISIYRDCAVSQTEALARQKLFKRHALGWQSVRLDIRDVADRAASCQNEYWILIALHISRGEVHPYVALSYTWGQSDRLVTSRRSKSLNAHLQEPGSLEIKKFRAISIPGQKKPDFECLFSCNTDNIPLHIFPQTQRDAILITKTLGFRFLWIDSLCIIQGDKQDWAHQAVLMTEIYGNASLTISSSSTKHNDEHILSPFSSNMDVIGSLTNPSSPQEAFDVLVGEPLQTLDLAEKFISTRGWVFQEILVSVATLHYTDEGMVWECAHGTHCGHDQNNTGGQWKTRWRDLMDGQFSTNSNAIAIKRPFSSHFDLWYDFVCSYSERNLYDAQDKFPAMAGVAKKFANTFKLSHDSYLAGLWKEDFLSGLMWRRHNRTVTLGRSNDSGLIAPSWSWASVTGLLEHRKADIFSSDTKGQKLSFECKTVEKVPGTYGELSEVRLFVEGYVQEVVLDISTHPGVRQKPYQACGVSDGFVNPENVLCVLDQPTSSCCLSKHVCWCLRIGSYNLNGREGDAFLLLEKLSCSKEQYCRVGYAETDAWFDRKAETPDSGLLKAAKWTKLYII